MEFKECQFDNSNEPYYVQREMNLRKMSSYNYDMLLLDLLDILCSERDDAYQAGSEHVIGCQAYQTEACHNCKNSSSSILSVVPL